MHDNIMGQMFIKQLEMEEPATRKCLERIPETIFEWKPHTKSMKMGYLVVIVADIPNWIADSIEKSEIDFATYEQFYPKSTAELVQHFDQKMELAKKVLSKVSDAELENTFQLKNKGQILYTATKKENVDSSIRHWVHHRGQLTVYMRLNDLPVPSIYGPSADDATF